MIRNFSFAIVQYTPKIKSSEHLICMINFIKVDTHILKLKVILVKEKKNLRKKSCSKIVFADL